MTKGLLLCEKIIKMIDFLKIYTNSKEKLETNLKNKFSDTICSLNYYTGEVQYPCRRYFENMEVRITEKMGIIRNSIHKYFNIKNGLGNNNYTDFYYCDMIKSFEQIQRIYRCIKKIQRHNFGDIFRRKPAR